MSTLYTYNYNYNYNYKALFLVCFAFCFLPCSLLAVCFLHTASCALSPFLYFPLLCMLHVSCSFAFFVFVLRGLFACREAGSSAQP